MASTRTPPSANLLTLIERTQALLQRIQAADMLSLTNCLERAGIRSMDIAHLSHSSVVGILADVDKQLRKAGVQTEELHMGQHEVRTLLGVLREMFGARGEMHMLLNEVVLDPGSAARVSKMNSKKVAHALTEEHAVHAGEGKGGEEKGAQGWMAPLSKLFTGVASTEGGRGAGAHTLGAKAKAYGIHMPWLLPPVTATASPLAVSRPMLPRFVLKLGPALAAWAGHPIISTVDATPAPVLAPARRRDPASG
ncbi:hypothetical protein K438DRAFT_25966 [Mycena galopus ATCC 62051]|nr:hypothetical protein K438DRAFT_25966 [Mycena galopus ATCC 62051]